MSNVHNDRYRLQFDSAEFLEKFHLLASRVLSRSRVEKLEDTLLNLEKLDDAREIGRLLTA